jgi:serine/threonine protein kinase
MSTSPKESENEAVMPERIGPFEILERAGRGGFGMVYKAEQQEPVRRLVALKVLKSGMESAEIIGRFWMEYQMLAKLHHPNIASIFQAGETENSHPYFAMEWVEGLPITEYFDRHNLSARSRLELFLDLSRGVQHAHQKGIIHRDLKPSNVLVMETDEGQPLVKVIDFGIAKEALPGQRSYDTTDAVSTGSRPLGTPQYMSPEQGRGDIDIDIRTDVYSLGILLYELLTGSTPVTGTQLKDESRLKPLDRIRLTEPRIHRRISVG